MKLFSGSTITAGITASVAVAAFMLIMPQLLGMDSMDITRDIGMAFNSQSPYLAGGIFLAAIGILWASLFGVFYNRLPGNAIMKGSIFGLIVGLFSLSVMPSIINSMESLIGMTNQYPAIPLAMNAQVIIMMMAYVVFGVILAISHQPPESAEV